MTQRELPVEGIRGVVRSESLARMRKQPLGVIADGLRDANIEVAGSRARILSPQLTALRFSE
ncbi:MAG: hypothetical protein HYV63_19835 [Candidatus Schekmanbacteria bacterium]|nr:hypothetical protein [Candidatus Schekmanbacteria bacterium]